MRFKKLPLIFALITFSVVVIVVAAIFCYDVTYAKSSKSAYLHSYNIVQGMNFYRHFVEIETEVQDIAGEERVISLLTYPPSSPEFEKAVSIISSSFERKIRNTDVSSISILDPDFNVLYSTQHSLVSMNLRSSISSDNLTRYTDVSQRQWITGMMQDSESIRYFAAVAKVYDESGAYIGSVVSNYSFAYFDYFIHNLSVGDNGFLFLIDSRGALVSDFYRDKTMSYEEFREWNPELSALYDTIHTGSARSGMIEFFSKSSGREMFASYYTIPVYDWILFSAIEKSEMYTEMYQHFFVGGLIAVVLLVLFVTLGFMFARRLTSPLIAFSAAMSKAMNGDFTSRWRYGKNDDYGRLAHSFNTMMDKIQKMFTELQETTVKLSVTEERYRDTAGRNDLDDLTGLLNQLKLMEIMSDSLEHEADISKSQAFLIIDITKFKNVNETYGYTAGNAVLKEIAGRLNRVASDDILVARGEGDSFMLFVKKAGNSNEAEMIASLVLDVFLAPVRVGEDEIMVNCSIGVVVINSEIQTADDVMACAFIALDEARTDDCLSYKIFNRSMLINATRRIQIRNVLEKNRENHSLQLYLQPQYDIQGNKLYGFEALMRLIDKDIGTVPPVEFIPIAEETGLIVDIGYWAIRECCRMTHRLAEANVQYNAIAVNISLAQIMQADFMRNVRNIISEEDANPARLEFEITESILLKSIDYGINILQELKDFGIKVVLDDFGSGYSSLNYIRALSIDVLKIDKAFIDEICIDEKARDITEMIINLAKKMNLQIIAEGIETEEQLCVLRELGCPIIQGFFYSRPVPEPEIWTRYGGGATATQIG